ncbi:A disintegrin and metallo ase with thrombospondin motifs 6-like [Paramuricea clavata]|uniref:A disintegrin and metallo ase with thrombospondin motifs 6-like n=1 Tax=Paramuricea clavata TaxID=317549 RepID=A0A7D9H9I1_PARCT|nr:A disintegrin and metallo ase with thrombospondin motifs 6-like [Paramuricea clavata]
MNSLSSFGKWAERNTVPDDSDPQHYDYATLFTRYSFKDKNQPCDTLGVTNVGGMCQFPNSVSICEDNGLMVGKTLAHETGHSLGMNHDLRPFCGDSKKMMSLHPEGSDTYEWSKCSRMFLKQFLDSSDSRCLEDRPRTKQAINVQIFNHPGLLYNADQQCALSYGDGAKYCKDKPPEWCKRGKCVEKYTEGPDAIDGGWSNWSQDYTECTRSCSGGVQYRTRQCSNPLPTNGGKFCEGEHREYKLCNTKKCVDETNFRNVQCEEKSKEMFNDKFFDWEWRPSNLMNKCTLGCFIKNSNQGYAFGNVEDGTNCDDDSHSKCINGECMHIGCDKVIGSSAKFDRCGVCNGDGSTCRYGNSTDEALKAKLTKKYKEQGSTFKKTLSLLHKMGYGVPEDYASAKMDEVISDFYWAVIKWRTDRWDDCSKTCNGGTRTRHVRCVQIVDGGIEYDVEDEMCDADVRPNTKEKCNKQECRPEWVAQPFGTCSTSCGRGVQSRKITCQKVSKDGDAEAVEEGKCSDFIKPNSEEYCNVHNPCPGEGECGGEHSQNKGFITSPGFPDNYPNGKECMHSIIVPNDKVVKLVFKSLDLSGGVNSAADGACTGDFVKIMDGNCVTGGTETRYCGNRNPVPFLSSGNKLCVKFYSDESRNSKGFNASFEAVDHPARPKDPCGSTITATVGLLASPNYPEPYPTNEMCNMTIKTLEGPIKLNFQYFDIGKDANCDEDYLLLQGDSEMSKLCGSNLPKMYNVSGNTLKLSFKSGQQNLNKIGFIATYVSGKELIAKSSQDKNKADVMPNKLSEINPVNDLTDSVRDKIPRPSNSVEFLPISSNSLDNKEVEKEEVSSHSGKVAVSAKSTEKDVKDKSASASITSTGAESAKESKVEKSATADKKDTRQTVLRPLQSVLEQSGSLMTRGQCPSPSRLSCINLLYSYPCQDSNACQLRGMDCCPTSCSYGPSMCVPKVWRECPLVTPYIAKVLHTCQTSTDCEANHICCVDMLGRRYCHKHVAIDK